MQVIGQTCSVETAYGYGFVFFRAVGIAKSGRESVVEFDPVVFVSLGESAGGLYYRRIVGYRLDGYIDILRRACAGKVARGAVILYFVGSRSERECHVGSAVGNRGDAQPGEFSGGKAGSAGFVYIGVVDI